MYRLAYCTVPWHLLDTCFEETGRLTVLLVYKSYSGPLKVRRPPTPSGMRHCVQCSRAGSLWVVLFRVAPEARSAQLRCLLRTAAAATTTTTTIWLGKMGRSGVPFPLRFACPTLQQMAKGYSCGKGLVGPCIGRNDVEVLAIAEVAALCQTQPQNS